MIARRGDVWIVDFGEPVGHEPSGVRPAVVVSADPLNESRADVAIVVPCTTTPRGLRSHIELKPGTSGLDRLSYAKCEDLRSVSEGRFVNRTGSLSADDRFQIDRALRYLLDL